MDVNVLSTVAETLTRRAALAAYEWVGRGDPKSADRSAVRAMREVFRDSSLRARILSGEGKKDDSPRLTEGTTLGGEDGTPVEVVVDPLDGTRLVAEDRSGAISAVALGAPGSFPQFPEVYMMKLAGGEDLRGVLDLGDDFELTLQRAATALDRPLETLNCTVVDRRRNQVYVETLRGLGCSVHLIDHGDVSAAIRAALPDHEVDLLAGIGNAPEGLLAAAALRGLGGAMQVRLHPMGERQRQLVERQPEVDARRVYGIEQMIRGNAPGISETVNAVFACTGVTGGELVRGVKRDSNTQKLRTETLIISPREPTVRRIQSTAKPV